jgi:hypothetical protein
MPKKEEKKKTPVWVWILLGILILIIILLLLFRPWAWFMFSTESMYNSSNPEIPPIPNYTAEQPIPSPDFPNQPNQPDQPGIPDPKPREFKTSDKLTEITFTRNLHSVEGDQTIDVREIIKVSGYLQEVPLTQTNINLVIDRAYIFNGGKMEWDIYGNELEADPEDNSCEITWTVQSKGSSIPDSGGKLQGLSTGDMLAISYAESGFDTFSPEIGLVLKAHILMPEVQDIRVNGEHTICNGETSSKTLTQDYTSLINLPLVVLGNPDTSLSYSGNFVTEYDSFETSGNAFLKEGLAGVPLDITFDDDDNWQIDYKVHMP